MDTIMNYIHSLNLDLENFLKIAVVLLIGSLIMSLFGRFVFGKRSVFHCSVSSAIAILFVYAVTVVVKSLGAPLEAFLSPLPFVSFSGDSLIFFSFSNAHYTAICSQLLSMIILAFLANLADGWLPAGKKFFSWLFFRCLTVVLALLMHFIVTYLFTTYLPEGLVTYAPTVLLGILVLMLLTGGLKIVVGAALSTVNPIIGGLYTFFFATVIGKQVTKAVLTTVILSALVLLLNYLNCTVLSIAASALIAYIPFVLILIALWYVVSHVLSK